MFKTIHKIIKVDGMTISRFAAVGGQLEMKTIDDHEKGMLNKRLVFIETANPEKTKPKDSGRSVQQIAMRVNPRVWLQSKPTVTLKGKE